MLSVPPEPYTRTRAVVVMRAPQENHDAYDEGVACVGWARGVGGVVGLQGQKSSNIVVWTFHEPKTHAEWSRRRAWGQVPRAKRTGGRRDDARPNDR